MKFSAYFFAASVIVASGFAQVTPPGPEKKNESEPANIAAIRLVVDEANTMAKANRVADAEQLLVSLNQSKPNTAEWHLETAQRLVQTAEQVARSGQPGSVVALAGRALQQLNLAETKAAEVEARAAARTMAGFIHERYLANQAAALASYQAAVQLAPNSATKAREAAERLRRTEENLKRKWPR